MVGSDLGLVVKHETRFLEEEMMVPFLCKPFLGSRVRISDNGEKVDMSKPYCGVTTQIAFMNHESGFRIDIPTHAAIQGISGL
jgi:hypothetical protein